MRRAAWILLLLTALWALDATMGSGIFWVHDLRHHHLPWRVWAASEWLHGRVPLWAPGVANGFPLMADGQTGVFYPPTMALFMVLPAGLALNASLLLHHWWAALGAWRLSRALGRSEGAALVGAVAFGFSGFLATHDLYLGMQNAVAWLPWLLAFTVAGRWRLAGVSAWMMLVAGHPQAAAFGLLLAGLVAVWRSWGRWPWGFTFAMALALLAASPQLIATLELSRFSMRDGGVGAAFADVGSLPPQELINAVLPRFFGFDRPGDILQTYYHRGTGYWGAGVNHWEMAFYLGLPAVALALAAVRRQRFWAGVAATSLLLMLGGPLWDLLRHLPGLGGFRFPARFALVLTVAVSVLAAAGVDALRGSGRRFWVATGLTGVLLWGGLGLGGVVLSQVEGPVRGRLTGHFMAQVAPPPAPTGWAPLLQAALPDPEPEDAALVPAKVDRIVADLHRSLSWTSARTWGPGLLLLLMGALGLATRRHPAWLAPGLALLLYADLWSFGAGYQVRVPRSTLHAEPSAMPIIRAEGGRVRTTVVDRRQDPALDTELMSASLGLLYGTRDVIITSPLLLVRNEAFLGLVGLDVGDRGSQKVGRLAAWPQLVDLLGLRWLLSVHDLTRAGYARVHQQGQVGLYRNDDPLPAAFLVGCADTVDDPWGALLTLDPRAGAFVESPSPLPACLGSAQVGTARIVEDEPQHMVIEVDTPAAALLVQADSWYPGWRAWVDGVPATLYRADLLFRGVVIPAGAHRVTLEYRPTAILIALGLMPVGLLLLLLLKRDP